MDNASCSSYDAMEALMSDFLAAASSKIVSSCPLTSCNGNNFITAEDLRQDMVAVNLSDDSELTTEYSSSESSNTSLDSNRSSTDFSYITFDTPPSAGRSPSPSYVRGDYYNLTPPSSLEVSHHQHHNRPRHLSFSIDSILGCDSTVTSFQQPFQHINTNTNDAEGTSISHFSFSMGDWDSFQRYRALKYSDKDVLSGFTMCLFWCHACEDTCLDSVDADAHQTFHRMNADECTLQRQLFENHGYVSTHTENGYDRIKCGLCLKVVTRRFFERHISAHEGYTCTVCEREFSTKCRLRDHENRHTGSTPYKCGVCQLSFTDRRQLNSHSRRHKPCLHKCTFCSKSFRSKYACAIHERIHTGAKPYVCQVPGCGKMFSQNIQLQLHFRFHKNE